MIRLQMLLMLMFLTLCACKTVRTVYDEAGNVVEPDSGSGGEKDLTAHLEKQFNTSFSTKKTEDGVPLSVSDKVSRYQRDIDEARRMEKDYHTEAYSGAKDEAYTMSFSEAGKTFSTSEAYTGGLGKRFERDLHPAFATPTRGVYGSDDMFGQGDLRSAAERLIHPEVGRVYRTEESSFSRDSLSGYVETRREKTPQPRVFSRDQYQRKTIDDTRAMLGRDSL